MGYLKLVIPFWNITTGNSGHVNILYYFMITFGFEVTIESGDFPQRITIQVIGIEAGDGVDGQVLITHDMLGMTHEFSPRFLRRYLNLYADMGNAIKRYIADVKSRDFPNKEEQY